MGTGTMFAINTDGTGFTSLYNFPYDHTAVYPFGLILSGNTFYGTASGGSSHAGTLFKVNPDGAGFSLLYDFAPTYWNSTLQDFTNSDGTFPAGGLISSGNTLYGTAYIGVLEVDRERWLTNHNEKIVFDGETILLNSDKTL